MTILLTGASGVVGQAIVAELGGSRVIGCVHGGAVIPGIRETVVCDLARPRLGLGSRLWDRLAREVDVIIHSAALTVWGAPTERYEAINVHGTNELIELARCAGAPIHLISTSFVRALQLHPLESISPGNVVRPYIASKLESERLLLESGVPSTIFRPTNLLGDSRTGASARPQIVQMLSEWICRGKAPYFPAHPGNLIDVVPVDLLAAAVAGAVETQDLGREYWVTSGAEALSVGESLEILIEHARGQGREIELAPVVDPRGDLPVALERVPAMSRPFLKVLTDVSEVTHACGGVLPSSLAELRERYPLTDVSDAEAYRRSLDYWAAQRNDLAAIGEQA